MRVAVAVRDRGRAGRVRQDDASCAVGRGRSASVRVGRARRRETTTPSCSCATSRPRFTASSRSRPRCSTRCPAQADRPGRSASRASGARWPRSSIRWCWCSTICMPSPIRPVWTCSRSCSSTFRPARRSRSRAGRSRRCRLPAGGRNGRVHEIGVADLRLDEQEAGLLLEAAGVELDASELSELTERTEGWPAGLYLAALSMQTGAPSSPAARASPATTGSCPSTSASSCCPGCRPRRRRSSSTPRCWSACPAGCATPCSRRRGRQTRSRRSSARTASSCRLDRRREWYRYHHLFGQLLRNELERSEPDVVAELNGRAMAWCIANDLTEAAVALRARCGRDGHRRRPARGPCPAALLRRPDADRGGVVRVVRRGRAGAASCTRRLRSVDPRADRAARRCGAVAGSRRRRRPRRARCRMAAPRSSRGSQLCART